MDKSHIVLHQYFYWISKFEIFFNFQENIFQCDLCWWKKNHFYWEHIVIILIFKRKITSKNHNNFKLYEKFMKNLRVIENVAIYLF
jgi:hypothetical protein